MSSPKGLDSEALALLDVLPVPVWIIDAESLAFLAVNKCATASYGYSVDEFLSMTVLDIRSRSEAERVIEFIETTREDDERHGVFRHARKNGEELDVEIWSRPITFRERKARIVTAVDVTGRVEAESHLRSAEVDLRELIARLATSEGRYQSLFERVPAGIYRSTRDGRLVECNAAFARVLGYESVADVMSHSIFDLYFTLEERHDALRRLDESKSLAAYEMPLRRKDGEPVWVLISETLVEDPQLGESVMEGTLVDITERKAAEELANHQAYHDALTDLPNRWLFRDRLSVALGRVRRRNLGVSVLVIGLDHFNRVNDSAGYSAGDILLRELSQRLLSILRHEDTIARHGGNEFLVALPEIDEKDLVVVLSKVLASIRATFTLGDHEVFLTGSVGVASFPSDGSDADELIRNAQSAMYRAKETGGDSYQFYTPRANERVHERLIVESALRKALDRDELVVYYQPQLDLRTWKVTGAEALIRWRRGGSLIYPVDFINIAEESGLIIPIGDWVLRTACQQALAWGIDPSTRIRVATNLSARQFADGGLVDRIERIIAETGIDPRMLDLEVTETLAMQDLALAQRVLYRLEDLGIRISMDDFGTGYSSLNYLRLLPIHTVKIDRYFVADMHRKRDRSIIRAIIELAHSLDMKVLAEGVETDEQLEALVALGCDEMQGFIYSKAVPPAEFARIVGSPPSFLERIGHS
ncbi:MAG TPA: EAL domain-containing protein [Thermoanaerobaculia bacterium]|nr:EAL domain-containing protein [Thermoanaerobaculia bacterium]